MRAIYYKILLYLFCAISALLTFFYVTVKDVTVNELVSNYGAAIIPNINSSKTIPTEIPNGRDSVKNTTASIQFVPIENTDLKYMLQWTSDATVPFAYMGHGQEVFIKNECQYTNCFVTSNRSHLGDYTKFDVIMFAGPETVSMSTRRLPKRRAPHQKYVFASIESAGNYPVCHDQLNGFFNWTWTYKLDSDAKWGYIVIKDSAGRVIGPKKDMHWIKTEDMSPVPENLNEIFKKKSKAVAWFVSNCNTINARELFAIQLYKELTRYKLSLDVYGDCGNLNCSLSNEEACDKMIERDYFFYLAFENAFSEDYVTEKVLHALKYNAIPIVFGGANYTRFMPDESYLNAHELGVKELAKIMNELIMNVTKYSEYFRWKSHYSYHKKNEQPITNDYCGFCYLLNNPAKVKKTTVYQDFQNWWDPPGACRYRG